jgi:ABC-type nitrate/sulfonate/bicarbonate transport system permease component
MNIARAGRVVALPVLLLVVWQLVVALQPPPRLLPMPTGVLSTSIDLLRNGDLEIAIWTSTLRVLLGFTLGAGAGLIIGTVMGWSQAAERNLDPLVHTFRNVAAIALVSLAIIWFGPRGEAAVFIVAYGAFFPVVLNTITAVHHVDRTLIRAARTMGVGTSRVLQTVVIPGSLPTVFIGLRLGMGTAWGAIIAAELTVGATAQITSPGPQSIPPSAASGGIGYLMFYLFDNRVDLNSIVAAMITVGVAAYLLDRLLRLAQVQLLPWARHVA